MRPARASARRRRSGKDRRGGADHHEGGSFVQNGMLVGLSRQIVLRRELDIVANNLANIGTTGFKATGFVFQEHLSRAGRSEAASAPDRRLSFVEDRGAFRDMQKGAFDMSGGPLDLALDGEGYFVVETPQGERYTRAGALKLDNAGRLVTNEGHPVLTAGGPIAFTAQESEIAIAQDGTVSTSQGVRGRLRIAQFERPQDLKAEGATLFRTDEPPQDALPGRTRIVQGALERSNVQPILETTRLIEITRAYQQLANMMQRTEELRRTAIEKLADVPA